MTIETVLDWIYPPRCGLCSRLGPAICGECREGMPATDDSLQPSFGPLDYWVAVHPYEGRSAQAVRRLKYARVTSLGDPMAKELRIKFDQLALDPDDVVPVPIHWARLAWRGFNQAELLAADLPGGAGGELVRIRRTRAQVGLNPERRATNLEGAFQALHRVAGRHILLVDDVLTTGHTARECARALKARGAAKVGALVYCAGSEEPPEEAMEWLDTA